jgi:hypothetical protein
MNGRIRFAAPKSARLYQPGDAMSESQPEIRPVVLNRHPINGLDQPPARPVTSSLLMNGLPKKFRNPVRISGKPCREHLSPPFIVWPTNLA